VNGWAQLGTAMITVGGSGLLMAIPLTVGEFRRMRWRLQRMTESVQNIRA
jgi:hypothetical protein